MERYITAEDVMTKVKAYRKTLSYDDQFDFDMEVKRMKLTDKGRIKLSDTVRSSEHRLRRYGILKAKKK